MMRSTTADAARRAQTSLSRATIREVNDNHLMQEVKYADVFHSETPSDFERWQMVGFTAVPMKQEEKQQKQQEQSKTGSEQGATGEGDWNHNQPQGDAAEALMLYVNGSRSHPVALVDDRRVRPYDMSEGESSHYSADGSGQMGYHKGEGYYLLTLDTAAQGQEQEKKRKVYVRHVNKEKQSRKPQKEQQGQQRQKFKHEGDTVNSEVIVEKDKVTVICYAAPSGNPGQGQAVSKTVHNRDGSVVVDCGTYRINANTITLNGTVLLGGPGANIKVKGMGDLLAQRVYIVTDSKDACCADAAIAALEARIAALEAE